MSDFDGVVLEWLKTMQPDVKSLEAIEPNGSDWDGDTEGGYYSTFNVAVVYRATDGSRHTFGVFGEDMARLWMHVMHSWPAVGAETS